MQVLVLISKPLGAFCTAPFQKGFQSKMEGKKWA